MRALLNTLFLTLFYVTFVNANPIDSRTIPLITEVFIEPSSQWYIELDLRNHLSSSTCSTTVYKLKIASLKETFDIAIYPDKEGIAVVTQSSIRSAKNVEGVVLQKYDTISIVDSMSNIWNFPIRPVAPWSSLYSVEKLNYAGECARPVETKDVAIGVRGNPPSAYASPFISEARMVSPTDWAIELDALNAGIPFATSPQCTLSRFRMQIGTSPTIYNVKALFDTNKIAVIRLSDVFNGDTLQKNITYPLTIKLLDSAWNNTLLQGLYWRFTLNSILDTNYSFINGGREPTLRTSIGKRIAYTTKHILNFVNEKREPVSDVFLYTANEQRIYNPSTRMEEYSICVRLSSIVNINQIINVSKDEKVKWYGASLVPLSMDPCINPDGFTGQSINLLYLDEAVTSNDTLTLLGAAPVVKNVVSPEYCTEKINATKLNNNKTLFSVYVNRVASNMAVRIFALDGKLIETISVGSISLPGTYTCVWNRKQRIQSGTYICRLTVDGIESKALKISF